MSKFLTVETTDSSGFLKIFLCRIVSVSQENSVFEGFTERGFIWHGYNGCFEDGAIFFYESLEGAVWIVVLQ